MAPFAIRDSRGSHKMLGHFLKGQKISRIGLGTAQFGMDYGYTKRMSQPQVDELLNGCRRSGVNFLDTAREYGDSEAKIGSYLKRHPGGNWVVATKIKSIPKGICSDEAALEKHISTSIRTSARFLGRSIQGLQLHNAEPYVVKNPRLWKIIEKLKNQGMFQEFGVSFYDPGLALWVLKQYATVISFIQVPFNVFDQRFSKIFKKAKQSKTMVFSRSTFLRGLITSGNLTSDPVSRGLAPYLQKLNKLGQKTALTISEIALLYAYNTKPIDTVLIGVKSVSEFEANLNTLKKIKKIRKFENTFRHLKVQEQKLVDPRLWTSTKPPKAVKKHKTAENGRDFLVLLQARMGSTRLPGKVMKPVLGKPMLLRQIERVVRAKRIGRLVVATTCDPSDDLIEKLCRQESLSFYRGSVEDVLDRFYKAARFFKAKHIVRITADCPLIDPELIDHVIGLFQTGHYDYVRLSRKANQFPDGLDVEVFSFKVLERAFREAKLPSAREHVTPYIYRHPEQFRIFEHENTEDLIDFRWTVDQKEDLAFVRKVYKTLYPQNPAFTTADILVLLQRRPELLKINAQYKRNEGYLRSLEKDHFFLKSSKG